MQNTGLDIKKILKRESRFIISDMIKNNRISLYGYFNELSASLIYLNYSDPDFRSKNNIDYGSEVKKFVNIDINLSVISVNKESGILYVNGDGTFKRLNDFKIVTYKQNTYGSHAVEYKMNKLLQKIKKDEQMLWESYQVYGLGVTR